MLVVADLAVRDNPDGDNGEDEKNDDYAEYFHNPWFCAKLAFSVTPGKSVHPYAEWHFKIIFRPKQAFYDPGDTVHCHPEG